MNYNKDNLVQIVKDYALEFGDFTLSSGQKSNYFIDASKLTLLSGGLRQITWAMITQLPLESLDAIGGPSSGADPLVAGILTNTVIKSHMRGFLVRKEPKDGKFIEGYIGVRDRVAIIEDVITTGGQTLRAIEIVEAKGAEVLCVVSLVDRLAGAREKIPSRIAFTSLMTIDDLGIHS